MMTARLLSLAGAMGLVSGACLAVDAVALDLVGNEDALPNTIGLMVPLFGAFVLTGIYVAVRTTSPSRLLDWGYVLNSAGLMLVAGVDFTVNYTLSTLDDDTVDALLESAPTRPAFVAAGSLIVVGTITFGAALIRGGFAPGAAWVYVLTAVPSGFAALLPDAVGAAAQAAAGLAVMWLGQTLRATARTVPAAA